jgi:hypothetical protein
LRSQLAGLITDVDGLAVAGANVRMGSRTTTSLSNGSFALENVEKGYQQVVATADIDGDRWSGETIVDVVEGERNRSINVMMSPEATQGGISGVVRTTGGSLIEGAKVFVSGPLGSTLAVTGGDGRYTVTGVPSGVTYTVTASLAGFVNDTINAVHVDPRTTSNANFVLATRAGQGVIPAPQNVSAQAWTISSEISRTTGKLPSIYDKLRAYYRRMDKRQSGPQALAQRYSTGRATPDGSFIEIDLFWDFVAYDDLFGYVIQRGSGAGSLADLALVRDPLTRVFFDADPALTPGVARFYAVAAIDTVDFPDRGDIGPNSTVVQSTPLQPCKSTSPINGAATNATPTLRWSAVTGASKYRVFVYDRFPDLQNDMDPHGAVPLWPTDLDNPGITVVNAPATSLVYSGPALQSGHTYYWIVIAEDTNRTALSASAISKFVVQ